MTKTISWTITLMAAVLVVREVLVPVHQMSTTNAIIAMGEMAAIGIIGLFWHYVGRDMFWNWVTKDNRRVRYMMRLHR